MTRSQVISNLITKYDKVVTGNDKSAIELAVFKIAICQLVDAAFSGGGGGGGGGTTIATVSDGIDASVDINTIISNLSSIDTRLTSINTGQLTQAGVQAAIQAAADIDTIITRLAAIETNTAGGGGGGGTSSATIASGVDASVDINTIITRLTNLDTGKLTQANVESAIQSAADIDTIIARLSTIVSNTTGINGGANSVITSYSHGSVSVNSSGAQILGVNANRKHLIIVNKSTTDQVDLFLAGAGVFGNGLQLLPGQNYEINGANLYQGVVRAITASGITVNLSISEGI